jgi:hypothetical protein
VVLVAALLGVAMPESASAQKGNFGSGGRTMSGGGRPVSTGVAPAPIVGKPVAIPSGQPRAMGTAPTHFHGGKQFPQGSHFHHGNQFHHGKHFHGTTVVTTAFVAPVWWGPYWYPPYPAPWYSPPPPGYYGAPPPPPPGWYFCPAYNAYYPPNVPCPY